MHRRIMGLIVFASCSSAMDLALLQADFQKKKDELADFIFDSRCFVFGMENGKHIYGRHAPILYRSTTKGKIAKKN